MTADPVDELLQAVFLGPADNTARLVLADYLMDHGDPRGELIQIQCTMATASGSKHDELAERERELLALRAPPQGTVVSYARGLCEFAKVTGNWANASQFLDGELVIHHLMLTGCAGHWDQVGRLLATLAGKLRTIEIEEVREWRELAAMLAAVPRPRYFVDLQLPYDTAIPSHWLATDPQP